MTYKHFNFGKLPSSFGISPLNSFFTKILVYKIVKRKYIIDIWSEQLTISLVLINYQALWEFFLLIYFDSKIFLFFK